MKNLIRQNIYFFLEFIFLVIVGCIILLTSAKEEVTLWVNARYSSFTDIFILVVNQMGTAWFCCAFVFAILLWKGWQTALKGMLCISGAILVTGFLKHFVFPGKLRPTLHFEGIADLRLLENVVQLETETFPSGHTTVAFAMVTFLAFIATRKKYHWILPLIAALVGYARIYMSQHFITDVYAGMIIGVIVTTVVYWSVQMFEKKKNIP